MLTHSGAYDIACPDPDCAKKGVVTIEEMENLVGTEMTKKHESFRLNLEVSLDDKRQGKKRIMKRE